MWKVNKMLEIEFGGSFCFSLLKIFVKCEMKNVNMVSMRSRLHLLRILVMASTYTPFPTGRPLPPLSSYPTPDSPPPHPSPTTTSCFSQKKSKFRWIVTMQHSRFTASANCFGLIWCPEYNFLIDLLAVCSLCFVEFHHCVLITPLVQAATGALTTSGCMHSAVPRINSCRSVV